MTGSAANGGLSDDQFSSALSLGFSFNFYGKAYTSLYVNSNGFLDFSQNTASTTQMQGGTIPSTTAPNGGVVAGAWDDLTPDCSATNPIRYLASGTSPYRVFTVQFTNVQAWNGGCTGATNTFQVKLYETYDWIEVIHNSVSGGIVGIEDAAGSVGLTYALASGSTVRFFTTNYLWPDGGYRTLDSTMTGGPVYTYNSISASGNSITLGNDAYSTAQPLNFNFQLYGEKYSTLTVNSNGYVRLDSTSGFQGLVAQQKTPVVLPTLANPGAIVAGYWADLDPSCAGSIYTQGAGTAPYRTFTVEFDGVGIAGSCTNKVSFQIVLRESTNVVTLYLKDVGSGTSGANAAIGIENRFGSLGVQYAYGSTHVFKTLAIDFLPSYTPRPGTWCDATKHLRYDVIDSTSASQGYAPVKGYPTTYSQLPYSYTSLAPPSGPGTAIAMAPDEDAWSLPTPNGPRPFNFKLFDTTSGSVVVDTNGFLSLDGAYARAGEPWIAQVLPDGDAANLVVAPLWYDLDFTGGSISYTVSGTAPNRVLTVEWNNGQWSTLAQPIPPARPRTNGYIFQAKLYETTNVVEFVYPRAYDDGPQNGYVPALPATFGIESSYGGSTPWQGGVGGIMQGASTGFTNYAIRYIPVANAVPLAKADTYSLYEEATLDVKVTAFDPDTGLPTTGVLANDQDELPCVKKTVTLISSPGQAASFTLNSDGSFKYTPKANWYGEDVFSYTVSDGVFTSAAMTVKLLVNPVNDAPRFTKGADQVLKEDNLSPGNGSRLMTLTGWASGIDQGGNYTSPKFFDGDATRNPPDVPQNLRFRTTVTSGGTLFETAPKVWPSSYTAASPGPAYYSGALAAPDAPRKWGDLTFKLAEHQCGSATVSVLLEDDGGTANGGVAVSVPQIFAITAQCVNDAPIFMAGANVTVNEIAPGGSSTTFPNWATSIAAGPAAATDEATQKVWFETEVLTNPWLFSQAPSVAPAKAGDPVTGDLAFKLADYQCGTAKVRATLRDSAAGTAPAQNRSAPQEFTITATCVDNAATYAPGTSPITVPYGAATYTYSGWATNISAGPTLAAGRPGDESGQKVRFDTISHPGGAAIFTATPAVSPSTAFAAKPWSGDLTFTVARGQCGESTWAFDLMDDASSTYKDLGDVLTVAVECPDATPVNQFNGATFDGDEESLTMMDQELAWGSLQGDALGIGNVAPGDRATLRLEVTAGSLRLASVAGLKVTAGAHESGLVEVEGLIEDLQAALDGLAYTPPAGSCGATESLTMTTTVTVSVAGSPVQYSDADRLDIKLACPPPKVTFTIDRATVSEGGEAIMTFQLDRTSAYDVEVGVQYDGVALFTDRIAPTTIRIPAGQVEATARLQAVADGVDEADELLEAHIVRTTYAELGAVKSRTLTILDADAQPKLQAWGDSAPEGNSGGTGLVFSIVRTGSTVRPVAVRFQLVAGTASAPGDFNLESGMLTIAPDAEPVYSLVIGGPGQACYRDSDSDATFDPSEPAYLQQTCGPIATGSIRIANPAAGGLGSKVSSLDADAAWTTTAQGMFTAITFVDANGDGSLNPASADVLRLDHDGDGLYSPGDVTLSGPAAGTVAVASTPGLGEAYAFGWSNLAYRDVDASGTYTPADMVYADDPTWLWEGHVTIGDVALAAPLFGHVVERGDAIVTLRLDALGGVACFFDANGSGTFDATEPVYLQPACGLVMPGDVRLANPLVGAAASVVLGSDPDAYSPTYGGAGFGFTDLDGDGRLDVDDVLYSDMDSNGATSVGDVQLSGAGAATVLGPGFGPSRTLAPGDGALRFLDNDADGAWSLGDEACYDGAGGAPDLDPALVSPADVLLNGPSFGTIVPAPSPGGTRILATIHGDTVDEEDETFRIILSDPRNATIERAEAYAFILDDDQRTEAPSGGTWSTTDMDGDGIGDAADNCMGRDNRDQADMDGDGRGDLCDADMDGDGTSNIDEYARGSDPRNPASKPGDVDGDKAPDLTDNCPAIANPKQEDADGDKAGDACDATPRPEPVASSTPSPAPSPTPSMAAPKPSPSPTSTKRPGPSTVAPPGPDTLQPLGAEVVRHPSTVKGGEPLRAAYRLPGDVTKARLELTAKDGTLVTFALIRQADGTWTADGEAPQEGTYTTRLVYEGLASAVYNPGDVTVESSAPAAKESASMRITPWGMLAVAAALIVLLAGSVVFLLVRRK